MDYVVIMGGGRVGLALAHLLIDEGYDITLIESDPKLCAEVASELDYFIATTGNDEANLLSCILVRKYHVEHVIARVSNPDHEEAFKEVGIEQVISPERAAASYLQKVVTRPNTAELMTIGKGDGEILDMTITNDKIVGKKYKDISPSKDFIIIATYQNGKLIIPQPDNTISRGEKVSVLVQRGKFKKVAKKLGKDS